MTKIHPPFGSVMVHVPNDECPKEEPYMYAHVEQCLLTLLQILAGWTHDTGLAIVLFTLGVRVLLTPLSVRIAKNTIAQLAASRVLEEIKATWKGSPSDWLKVQRKVLDEHGVKPLSSVLLVLAQSPVFIVLYRLFRYLNHPVTSVLVPWVPALTMGDPLHLVPLAAAILMALASLVTYGSIAVHQPQSLGAAVTGAITLVILWSAPVAVALYYVTSGLWSALERWLFGRILVRRPVLR